MFSSNTGDIVTLQGQGRQIYTNDFSDYSTNDPGCGNINHWLFEVVNIDFTGTNDELNKLTFRMLAGGGKNYSPPTYDDNGLALIIRSNNSTPFISFATFASYANDTTNYKDSVIIDGQKYIGIHLADSSNVLYNYHYGILRFKDANQHIWTRKL